MATYTAIKRCWRCCWCSSGGAAEWSECNQSGWSSVCRCVSSTSTSHVLRTCCCPSVRDVSEQVSVECSDQPTWPGHRRSAVAAFRSRAVQSSHVSSAAPRRLYRVSTAVSRPAARHQHWKQRCALVDTGKGLYKTRSPAVARVDLPHCLYPKASVRLLVAERKRFLTVRSVYGFKGRKRRSRCMGATWVFAPGRRPHAFLTIGLQP